MGTSELYNELNRRWKTTCKVVFGEEVGELGEYEQWLSEHNRPRFTQKSAISGKEVSFVLPHYSGNVRYASLDEVDFNKKFEPLTVNEIKDIDSIIEAVRDRAYYAGNMQLGNSRFIEGSTDIIESFYIYNSAQISFSKYVAYGYNMEYAESVFGSMNHGHCGHSLCVHDADYLTRCFEVCGSREVYDSIYCQNLLNCKNCLFTFNLRNASYAIGNLRLPPEKYLLLKAKLLAEIASELKANKRLPSILELAGNSEPDREVISRLASKVPRMQPQTRSPGIMEKAFENTTAVLFGKALKGLTDYESWLKRFTRETKRGRSALTGEEVIIADHSRYFNFPSKRLVKEPESLVLGAELSFTSEEVADLSFKNVGKHLGRIAFFTPEVDFGELSNNIESQVNVNAVNCFRSILNLQSKNCAYNFYVLESESIFGCNSVRRSSFLVKCYCSSKLVRSFEVDSSRDCSDAYFCHNCENVRDSMFCFNTKNKRFAIGNAEIPREKYSEIKRKVCSELLAGLEKDKNFPISIFTIYSRPRRGLSDSRKSI